MNKSILLVILLLLYPISALSADVSLIWDPVIHPDLKGYKLHYGFSSGSYAVIQDVGNIVTYTFTGLDEKKRHYFVATAYSIRGLESDYSNEVFALGETPRLEPNLRLK
jgi:hypothetical protein